MGSRKHFGNMSELLQCQVLYSSVFISKNHSKGYIQKCRQIIHINWYVHWMVTYGSKTVRNLKFMIGENEVYNCIYKCICIIVIYTHICNYTFHIVLLKSCYSATKYIIFFTYSLKSKILLYAYTYIYVHRYMCVYICIILWSADCVSVSIDRGLKFCISNNFPYDAVLVQGAHFG